jgi:hypothetical protein
MLMSGFFQTSKKCYCAFCRSPRLVYKKRHVSILDMVYTALAALLLSLIVWQDLDPRLSVFFALFLGLSEVFILLRWRFSVSCPHCGFDPVLYKRSPERAASQVNVHMAARRQSPMSAFTPPPRLPSLKRGPKPPEAMQ